MRNKAEQLSKWERNEANVRSALGFCAGYSTLGIIPSDTIAAWLQQLINNPSFRDGTVRWNPNDPSKCSSKRSGCTKSIHITVRQLSGISHVIEI